MSNNNIPDELAEKAQRAARQVLLERSSVRHTDADLRQASEVARAVLEAVADDMRAASEKAWNEGYSAGQRTDIAAETQAPNPYRAD